MNLKPFFYLTIISLLLSSCSEVELIVPEEGNAIEITNTGTVKILTDNGDVGVILDVRPINYKGYTPKTATISFPDHSRFNTVLEIDQDINLVAFRVRNDSLSLEEKQAFSEGVLTSIVIKNGNKELSTYDGNLNINSFNEILTIDTDLEFLPGDVNIPSGTKQLIAFKTQWRTIDTPSSSVLTRNIFANILGAPLDDRSLAVSNYPFIRYDKDMRALQFFYFDHVEGNKYNIRLPEVCIDDNGNVVHCPNYPNALIDYVSEGYIGFNREYDLSPCNQSMIKVDSQDEAAIFELVPKENGWMNMFLIDENAGNPIECGYWTNWDDEWNTQGESEEPDAFVFTQNNNLPIAEIRIISDDIDYEVLEVNTVYYQPIMGPTELDFSYRSTIVNCSQSTIEESVGRVETKSRTTSVSTTESFQLFSSTEKGWSATVGMEVEIGKVKISGSYTENYKYTVSTTIATENTINKSFTDEIEVSRVRTATILPYSGVEIFDYIESNNNVIVPFVKKLRISGINKSTNIRLSGIELVSAIEGNLFGGLITKIDEYYIEVSIRGNSLVNSAFIAFSGANEIEDACVE